MASKQTIARAERLLLSGVAECEEQAIYMAIILSCGMSPKEKLLHVALAQEFGPDRDFGINLCDDEYLDLEERFNRGTFGVKALGSA